MRKDNMTPTELRAAMAKKVRDVTFVVPLGDMYRCELCNGVAGSRQAIEHGDACNEDLESIRAALGDEFEAVMEETDLVLSCAIASIEDAVNAYSEFEAQQTLADLRKKRNAYRAFAATLEGEK